MAMYSDTQNGSGNTTYPDTFAGLQKQGIPRPPRPDEDEDPNNPKPSGATTATKTPSPGNGLPAYSNDNKPSAGGSPNPDWASSQDSHSQAGGTGTPPPANLNALAPNPDYNLDPAKGPPTAGGPTKQFDLNQAGFGGPNEGFREQQFDLPQNSFPSTAGGPTINGLTGASYIDPVTGKPTNSATPPTGVVYRPSEALLDGGTRTATGDKDNPLRGYVSPEGGSFGGYDAAAEKAQMDKWKAKVAAAGPIDYSKFDLKKLNAIPNLDPRNRSFVVKQTGVFDQYGRPGQDLTGYHDPAEDLLNREGPLSPEELYLARQKTADNATDANTSGPYRADSLTGEYKYDQNLGLIHGIGADGKPMTGDKYDHLVQAGVYDKAGADQLRADQKRYDADFASRNPKPTSNNDENGITTQNVDAKANDENGITTQNVDAKANFDPISYLKKQLAAPTPYDDPTTTALFKRQSEDIQDQFDTKDRDLKDWAMSHGLGESSIYGGNQRGLNVNRRSAQEDLNSELLKQRAASTQQGQMGWLDRLTGAGNTAFNQDLQTQQQNTTQQELYLRQLQAMLGA